MNASPKCRRVIASFTILASAVLASLAGCSSKTNPAPAVQTASAPTTNSAPATTTPPAPAPEPGLTLPRGTRLEVRLNQTINVKHVESGDRFTGTLA